MISDRKAPTTFLNPISLARIPDLAVERLMKLIHASNRMALHEWKGEHLKECFVDQTTGFMIQMITRFQKVGSPCESCDFPNFREFSLQCRGKSIWIVIARTIAVYRDGSA